ncbi:hypothetical protein BKA22_003694 [Cellulomonas soli]|nr:hypothetical protein [Cellulomonas soli]
MLSVVACADARLERQVVRDAVVELDLPAGVQRYGVP